MQAHLDMAPAAESKPEPVSLETKPLGKKKKKKKKVKKAAAADTAAATGLEAEGELEALASQESGAAQQQDGVAELDKV